MARGRAASLLVLAACGSDPELAARRSTSPSTARADLAASERRLTLADGAYADRFGRGLSGAGDVDGDGFDDAIVGAPGDSRVLESAGSAWVWLGSTTGLQLAPEAALRPSDPEASLYFGASVSGGGDLNGDGYGDVAIAAYGDDTYKGGSMVSYGAVYLYFGSPTGLDAASEQKVIKQGERWSGVGYGALVGVNGDVDGDGIADLLVSEEAADHGAVGCKGAFYVYLGSLSGVRLGAEQLYVDTIKASGDGFGDNLGYAGDIDGDGFDDVLTASIQADLAGSSSGAAWVLYGSTTGLSQASEQQLQPSTPAEGDGFGVSATGAGDVNGDGYSDVAVGSWWQGAWEPSAGTAFVYLGSSTGVDLASEQVVMASDAGKDDRFSRALAGVGDLDADGFDDLAIGAPDEDNRGDDSGAVYLYYGAAGGLDVASEQQLRASDARADAGFGYLLAGGGDFDGSGTTDLLVGVYRDDEVAEWAGKAYAYISHCTDSDSDGSCRVDDCDDRDDSVHPGAVDVCGDGIDSDCDGSGLGGADEDGDGLSSDNEAALGTDPCVADTDGDGLSDSEDPDPLTPSDTGSDDGGADTAGSDGGAGDGGGDGGGSADGGADGGPAADSGDASAKNGCGCAASPGSANPLFGAGLLLLLVVGARRRASPRRAANS